MKAIPALFEIFHDFTDYLRLFYKNKKENDFVKEMG
jgi:hypothetical protein